MTEEIVGRYIVYNLANNHLHSMGNVVYVNDETPWKFDPIINLPVGKYTIKVIEDNGD